MTEQTDLVPQDEVRLGDLAMRPDDVVQRGAEIATALAKVINDNELYSVIRNRKYVKVDGWTTLGSMMGVTPRTVDVREIEEGIFEATVELVRTSDGAVIGRGIAECGADDEVDRNGNPVWADRPRYARKSMAITRATGKAFRLAFSWIIQLAGYSTTPAEEMDFVEGEYKTREEKSPPRRKANPVSNGDRPYEPDKVREKLQSRASDYEGKSANEKQFGLALGMLEECFAGLEDSSDRRRSVLAYAFEVDSGNDLTDAQVLALLDWLAPEKDSGDAYRPGEYVASEAGRIVKARMVEQGQDALFPEEEAA